MKIFPDISSYSSVAKKNKNELQKICRILELPSEELGKNALISIVCNSLQTQTSCSKPDARDSDILFTSGDVKVPACERLGQVFTRIPFTTGHAGCWKLLGDGFTHDQIVKCKTNRAWDHKRGIDSVR